MTFNFNIVYPVMAIFGICLVILILQRRNARKRRWQREDAIIRNIKGELSVTPLSTMLGLISALTDEDLLDRYLSFSQQPVEPDFENRLVIELLRAEWSKRHPGYPMPSKAEGYS